MSDIVEQLRDRAYSSKFVDTLLAHAADEIERLRKRALSACETVTLTDAERDAVEALAAACEVSVVLDKSPRMASTLRGLLERLA